MTSDANPILTVGHSNHSLERVIELLEMNSATSVADVRSVPYSRLHPDFNRESLQRALDVHGVRYVFLGRELGARSDDPSCYEDGRVRYRKLAQTELFREGVARVMSEAKCDRIALLCAEKEPLACHRSLLVARELESLGASILHIQSDGSLEPHTDSLSRLLAMLQMPESDLFRTREQLIDEAYARQEQRVAYTSGKMRADTDGVVP